MLIEIIVEPKKSVRWPKMKLVINDTVIHNDFCFPNNKNYLVIKHELQNPKKENTISLTHFDKVGNETIIDNEKKTLLENLVLKTISTLVTMEHMSIHSATMHTDIILKT